MTSDRAGGAGAAPPGGGKGETMTARWEYRTCEIGTVNRRKLPIQEALAAELTEAGEQGWELVAMPVATGTVVGTNYTLVFKRPAAAPCAS